MRSNYIWIAYFQRENNFLQSGISLLACYEFNSNCIWLYVIVFVY